MAYFERLFQNRYLIIALCLLPLVLYGLFFWSIALNVNYVAYDDIHVLQIVEQWQHATTWREKLDWLTVGFPEHRIVFTRTVVLLSYFLTGTVNFKSLMMISNLLWISQLVFLYQIFKKITLPLFYFIPVCWIVLNVHSFENIFWGTSSLGNFGLLFFVMAAGYFYAKSSVRSLAWALLFSFLATFTYGNGLLTFLIGILLFLVTQRWREAVYTLGGFVFTMLLYALTRAHASPSGLDLTQPSNYLHALSCFLAFIGSSVNFDAYAPTSLAMWLSVGWGAVLIATMLWFITPKIVGLFKNNKSLTFNQIELFALFLFLFVCLSALGVVYKRAEGDGLVGMFKGRYRMYPTWGVLSAYLLVISYLSKPQKWVFPSLLATSIVFNLLVLYYAIAPAVNNRRAAVAQEFNSMYNEDLLGLKMFDLTGQDFLRLQKLYQPDLFFRRELTLPLVPVQDQIFALDSVYFVGNNLQILYTQDFIRPTHGFDDGAYIILSSLTHTYMCAGIQQALPLKTFIRRGWYWDKGFSAGFNRASVAAGEYSIYVLLRKNGKSQLLDTQRKVTF